MSERGGYVSGYLSRGFPCLTRCLCPFECALQNWLYEAPTYCKSECEELLKISRVLSIAAHCLVCSRGSTDPRTPTSLSWSYTNTIVLSWLTRQWRVRILSSDGSYHRWAYCQQTVNAGQIMEGFCIHLGLAQLTLTIHRATKSQNLTNCYKQIHQLMVMHLRSY